MKMSGHISVYNRISTRRFLCRPQTHPQPFRDGKHNGVAGYSLFTIAQEENDYTIRSAAGRAGRPRAGKFRMSPFFLPNRERGITFLTGYENAV